MTEPDDLQRRLKGTLHGAAQSMPPVDLADAALRQAGRIRRRRRLAGAAACVLAAAVVVPVGLRLGIGGPNLQAATGPPTTAPRSAVTAGTMATQSGKASTTSTRAHGLVASVAIKGSTQGEAPKVGYVDGSSFHGTTGAVDLEPTGQPVKDVAQFADGVGVWTENTAQDIKRFSSNGVATTLPSTTTVSNPAIDSVNQDVAWAVHDVDASGSPTTSDTLLYTDSLTATPHAIELGSLQVRHVMGAAAGIVVFNAVDLNTGDDVVARADMPQGTVDDAPWPRIELVTAVSPNLQYIAGLNKRDRRSPQMCTTMFDGQGAAQWTSCEWRPMEFSTDGSRVLAAGPNAGLGPHQLAVMTSGGKVLREFTSDGTFGRATFEDDGTIVAVLVEGHQAAIMRCHVDGGCERATPAEPVRPHSADSLLTPYQITAN